MKESIQYFGSLDGGCSTFLRKLASSCQFFWVTWTPLYLIRELWTPLYLKCKSQEGLRCEVQSFCGVSIVYPLWWAIRNRIILSAEKQDYTLNHTPHNNNKLGLRWARLRFSRNYALFVWFEWVWHKKKCLIMLLLDRRVAIQRIWYHKLYFKASTYKKGGLI